MDNGGPVSATDINELHAEAERWRDAAVSSAGKACKAAIQCGELLNRAKVEHAGEFTLWLESNVRFSHDTATRYMRCAVKFSAALRDGLLDFQTLKELYIATGIMPGPVTESESSTLPLPPVWVRLTSKLDSLIENLKGEDKGRLRQWCEATLARL